MYTIEYLVLHSSLQYRSHWFQKNPFKILTFFYSCRRRASKSKTRNSLVPKLSEKQTFPRLKY